MGQPHVLSSQLPQQLGLVVAWHAERTPSRHHRHDHVEHAGRIGPAIDEVPHEHGAAGRVSERAVGIAVVAELREQRDELSAAAVDVADDVERTVLVALVVPHALPLDHHGLDLLWRREHGDVAKAFALQLAERLAELGDVLASDVLTEASILPLRVARVAELGRQVEDDGHGQHVLLARERDERLAR